MQTSQKPQKSDQMDRVSSHSRHADVLPFSQCAYVANKITVLTVEPSNDSMGLCYENISLYVSLSVNHTSALYSNNNKISTQMCVVSASPRVQPISDGAKFL